MVDESMPRTINWRRILIAVGFALVIAAFMGYSYFRKLFMPNVPAALKSEYLYVPTGTVYKGLLDSLVSQGFIVSQDDFEWVAEKMSFDQRPVRAGRFKIQPKWTNHQLISYLRIGKQEPVDVIFTDERLPEDIAKKAARYIEPSAQWLTQFLTSPDSLQPFGLTPETVTTIFIPNTYKLYWNTSPRQFVERMIKERDKFWAKKGRLAKAKAMNLTPEEIYTVASIVERESNYNPEKPKIASVYLNRVKIGMKLQADPTCVFATRDFGARRVTNYHLKFESPYNTYLHEGLPPGPISMASIASIDAVLNPATTDYIFFCAKPGKSGQHAFAKTNRGHEVNVRKFRAYMAKRRQEKALEQAQQ